MSTVPEKRVNKNGHLVTKHVNPDKGGAKSGERIKRLPSWNSPISGQEMQDDSPLITDLMEESTMRTPPYGRVLASYLRFEHDRAVYGVRVDLTQVGAALLDKELKFEKEDSWEEYVLAVEEYGRDSILDKIATHYGAVRSEWHKQPSLEFAVPYPDGSPEGVSEDYLHALALKTTNVNEFSSPQDNDNLAANIRDVVSIPSDWTLLASQTHSAERKAVVRNPEGTAEYSIRIATEGINKGDVYVELHDLETGLKAEFRAFLGLSPKNEGEVQRVTRIYQAPPLPPDRAPRQELPPIADFKKFSADDEAIDQMVRIRLTTPL